MKHIYFIIGFFYFGHSIAAQQCSMTESIEIPDNNTPYSVQREVNIRSPGEKILCSVRLSFEHEYAEELRFELISPSGKKITLISGGTSSANTSNSSWDILFGRNEDRVQPDPFQKELWGENNWDKDREYSGSYFPDDEKGLEHFDGERGIGTWSLVYQDLVKGSSGRLIDFELIFCDNRTICQPCDLSSDLMESSSPLSFCGGDSGLREIQPSIIETNISQGFDYLLIAFDSLGNIRDRGKSIDLSREPAGKYSISAVQFRSENSDQIVGTNSRKQLKELMGGLHPKVCGVFSSTSRDIHILSDIDPEIQKMEVYGRDYIVIEDEVITRDTTVISEKTDENNCTKISHIDITFHTYTTDFTQPQTYNCNNTSVTLIVRNSKNFPVRRWFTRDGIISNESGSRSNEIKVEAPGTYHVIFEIEDYFDTVAYTLDIDPQTPVFFLDNQYTLCTNDTLNLQIGRNFENAWIEQNSSAYIEDDILFISEPGLYTLKLQREDCIITKNVIVMPPDSSSEITLPDEKITCKSQTVTIDPELEDSFDHYAWYINNQKVGDQKFLQASEPGYYTFRAYNSGDCGITASVWVDDQIHPFDLEIHGPDLIHCRNKDSANTLRIGETKDHIPVWTDPEGNITEGNSVPISSAGLYRVEILDEEGCVHSSDKQVQTDTTMVSIKVPDEIIIPCEDESTLIRMELFPPLLDYEVVWEGAQREETDLFAIVKQPGEVKVTATNLNSFCTETKSIEIKNDPQKPKFIYDRESDKTINCHNPLREIEYSIENCTNCVLTPQSKNDIILDEEKKKIIAREPGEITIHLINQEGCRISETIRFPSEMKATPLNMEIKNIGCEGKTGEILIKNEDRYSAILLKNETDTLSYDSRERYLNPVKYTIIYTDRSSGCTDSTFVNIEKKDTGPQIELEPIKYLDCHSREAVLSVKGDEISEIIWMDSDRNKIGDENQISVSQAGKYTLYVRNEEWCTTEGNIEVIDDTSIPEIDVKASYEIPCSSSTEGFTLSYDTSRLENVNWLGPRGFSSAEFHPVLIFPGEYRLEITGKNGCSAHEIIQLEEETFDRPPAIIGDPITCSNPSSRISLSDYSNLEEILWIDESGHSSQEEIFEVFNPGKIKASLKNKAGCLTTAHFTLEQDLDKVLFNINRPIINCDYPAPEMVVELDEDASRNRKIKYTWYRDSTKIGEKNAIEIREPAEYKVKVEYENGCADSLSHFVAIDTIKPTIDLPVDTINCRRSKIQLSEVIDTEQIQKAAWRGPKDFESDEIRPGFTLPGPYTVLFTASNGCSQITDFYIYEDKGTPQVDSIDFASLGCNGKKVPLEYFTQDSIIEQYWLLPDQNVVDESAIEISEKGEYILFLKGENHCSKMDTFRIDEQILPEFSLEIIDANCKENTGSALVIPEKDTFTASWFTESGDLLSAGSESTPLLPGTYRVTVTNPINQCDSVLFFDLVDLSEVMEVEIGIDDSLRCERTTANLIPNVYPHSPHYIYEWKINNRDHIFSRDSIATDIEELGWYSLKVTDTLTYCTKEDTFLNIRALSTLKGFDLWIKDPACHIDQPGSAIVNQVYGALDMDKIKYSLNGNSFYEMDTFPALYANTPYTISAKDQYGCTIDTMLFLELRGIMDRIGNIRDTLINKGDIINLNDPNFRIQYTSADDPMAEKYNWIFNPDVYACDFPCEEEINVAFPESRFGTVILTNEYGCTMQDSFHIYVAESEVINIPTGIIPASMNEENAHACIYTNQYISNINMYIVFDHQGSVIFRKTNFDPRENIDYENCWNGRDTRGNIMPQGNYNYYVNYETVYGSTKEKYGNLFLLR